MSLSSLLANYAGIKRKAPENATHMQQEKAKTVTREEVHDPPPDFIILGAQKAGTMAAVKNLNKHPEIFVLKEPHFFDLGWHSRTISWYCKQFSGTGKRIRGEKTPELIYVDECAHRMKQVCPDAKFILFLRDPVKRAYSAWNMNINRNTEEHPFDTCCKRNFDNLTEFRSHGTAEYHYVQRGFYMDQIDRFLKEFPERNNLLIVIAEHVRSDPQREYRRIFDFLGAQGDQLIELEDEHVGSYSKPMSEAVAAKLRKLYQPHNERLFAFLGFRIPEWESVQKASDADGSASGVPLVRAAGSSGTAVNTAATAAVTIDPPNSSDK